MFSFFADGTRQLLLHDGEVPGTEVPALPDETRGPVLRVLRAEVPAEAQERGPVPQGLQAAGSSGLGVLLILY